MPRASIRHLLSGVAVAALTFASTAAAPERVVEIELTGEEAGQPLALALADLAPLDATAAACELALSPEVSRRLAIASALEWSFALVGDDFLVDHLIADRDPQVRRAAARAAWIRGMLGADRRRLARLAADPDPAVRFVAALAGPHR
jgi:hypothetical protein